MPTENAEISTAEPVGCQAESERMIRVLPPLVVNQIAAGEVVERPASVVRELLDNAVDAGSTRIVIELEQGGVELIRVTDDGAGMSPDQLPLAIHPHATSKISQTADLDAIGTMGFRGEALASIASVSRMAIRSRRVQDAGAHVLAIEGDHVSPAKPEAGPVGTSVTVRNLFFNTPARRKFLRTPQTEQGHCADAVKRIALANPRLGMTFKANGKVLMELPPDQQPRDRAFAVIGSEFADQYLQASVDTFDDARGVAMWGLVGTPALAKANNKHQFVFLNGRFIKDKTIQHALREAYRGLTEPGKHPAAVLMIEMDPRAVDVNVHPAKLEVRFRDGGLVYKVVHRAVREALMKADLTPSDAGDKGAFRFERPDEQTSVTGSLPGGSPQSSGAAGAYTPSPAPPAQHFPQVNARDFANRLQEFRPANASGTVGGRFDYDSVKKAIESADSDAGRDFTGGQGAEPSGLNPQAQSSLDAERSQEASGQVDDASAINTSAPRPSAHLQVHNSYLVTQDDSGIVIIDQHALHERVMFEQLAERIQNEPLQSQRLLMPVVVDATADQLETVTQEASLMERLGIEAEAAGPTTLAVHAFPVFLLERNVEPAQFMTEVLDQLAGYSAQAEPVGRAAESCTAQVDPPSKSEQLLHEVLDMMACKAAVKAGDRMSQTELAALVAMREDVERSSSCPHGRPTAIRLTIKELERQFGRS